MERANSILKGYGAPGEINWQCAYQIFDDPCLFKARRLGFYTWVSVGKKDIACSMDCYWGNSPTTHVKMSEESGKILMDINEAMKCFIDYEPKLMKKFISKTNKQQNWDILVYGADKIEQRLETYYG